MGIDLLFRWNYGYKGSHQAISDFIVFLVYIVNDFIKIVYSKLVNAWVSIV